MAAGLLCFGWLRGEAATNASFSIQREGETFWFAKPDGSRFFSLGVCVVDQGCSREKFSATNPAYAAFQHYANSNDWAEATLKRLKSWHFTTVGGWSDFAALKRCSHADMAFIPVLAAGMTCGAPWRDMWDTNIIEKMRQVARERILPLREDPRVLGYYTDNEMGWWNAALFKLTLEQPAFSGQRQRLLKLLRENYHDSWPALLQDFDPEGAASFDELDRHGMLYLRPGGEGIRICRRFLGLMAERYYSLMRDIVHECDPRGLILGDRYQSFYYPEVARASGVFVDASSSNLNAAWNDGTFPRFYLSTLHALTGKPIIVSEFYMAARQNRTGDRNAKSDFPVVDTQAERGVGFRNTIRALLRLPWVIGADWFEYYDEPPRGRGDGEDYNFGLVDIHDRPYEPLTAVARSLDTLALKSKPPTPLPDASLGVPRAPRDPLGNFTIRRALEDWDRERGFVKPSSEFPMADMYVCWDKHAVYLGLYAEDIAEKEFYRNNTAPEADRAVWSVTLGRNGKDIHARLGPFGPAVCDEPAARLVNLSGVYMNTRNIAALELPARLFGKQRFRAGDRIELHSSFVTHSRATRVEWKGAFRLVR